MIFLGDPELSRQLSEVPSPALDSAGYPEGSSVPTGNGQPVPVRRYLAGATFAEECAFSKVPSLTDGRCQSLAIDGRQDMPEAADQLNQVNAGFQHVGMWIRGDVGSVSFHCAEDWVGSVMAQTQMATQSTSTLQTWYLDELSGYAAGRSHAAQAADAQAHLLATFRVDPDWGMRQSQLAGDVSGIYAQTQEQIARLIHDAFQQQAAAEARNFAGFAEGSRGEVMIEYPDGSRQKIWNTSTYYWLTREGNRVGTDSPAPPADIDIGQALHLVPAH